MVHGKGHQECRALDAGWLKPNFTAVPLDHAADNRQAHAFARRHVRMDALKSLEDLVAITFGNADAVVPYEIGLLRFFRDACSHAPYFHDAPLGATQVIECVAD